MSSLILSLFFSAQPCFPSSSFSTINSPQDGSNLTGTISIEVNYIQPVEVLEIYIDSELYDRVEFSQFTGIYTKSWDTGAYADGPHLLQSYAYMNQEGALGQGSNIVNVVVDNTSPIISDLTPSQYSVVSESRPEISARLLDDTSGINHVLTIFKLDSVEVPFSYDEVTRRVSYTPDFDLDEHQHVLKIKAWDLAGNMAFASCIFFVDAIKPTITITSPEDGFITRQSSVTVAGTVADQNATVRINGVGVSLAGGQFSTTIDLQEGENVITVAATDPTGYTLSKTVTVTRDSTDPVITIYSPLSGALLNNTPISVSGDVDDTSAIVTVNTVTASVDPDDGSFAAEGVVLNEGNNEIVARAEDGAGNVGTDSINVTLDMVFPVISIASPPDGTATNQASIDVSGTIDDSSATVLVNGVVAPVDFGSFTAVAVGLEEGDNSLQAEATDPAGNLGVSRITVVLDTTPPEVVITSPPDGSMTRESSVTVAGTVDDGFASVSVNGTPVTVDNGVFSSLVSLVEESNVIQVQAVDSVNNVGEASITVIRDTEPPDAPSFNALTSPTGNTRLVIVGTAEPDAVIRVTGGAAPVSGPAAGMGAFNLVIFLNPNLGNTLSLTATDPAWNVSTSAGVSVTHDSIAPSLSVLSPEEGTNFFVMQTDASTIPVIVTGTVSDLNGISSLSIDGNPVTVVDAGFQTTVNLPVPEEAGTVPHTIPVEATDNAGNEMVLNRGVTVELITNDTDPPVITITSPLDGSFFNQSEIALEGTVADASPITSIEYTIDGGDRVGLTAGNSFDTTVTLPGEGEHTIVVYAQDDDLGTDEGSDTVSVTLDTESPEPPVVNAVNPPSPTNSGEVAVMGTYEPGFGVRVERGEVVVESVVSLGGNYSVFVPLEFDTVNNLRIRGVDRAANISLDSVYWEIEQDSTPPVDITVMPQNGTTARPLDQVVGIFFSEEMKPETLTSANVRLEAGGSVISSLLTIDPENDRLTLAPYDDLADSLMVTVKISPPVADLAGNQLPSTFTSTFTTIDQTPPVAVVVSPAPPTFTNSTAVEIAGTAEAGSTVTIKRGGDVLGTDEAGSEGDFEVTAVMLLPNQANEFEVFATDWAANTGPEILVTVTHDNISPEVVGASVDPPDQETGVPSDKIVTIPFDEPLNPVSVPAENVAGGNIVLTAGGGAAIPGVFTLNGEKTTVSFTPAIGFPDGDQVTIEVTAGIKDRAGNQATPYSSVFSATDTIPPDPPVVTDISPPSPTNNSSATVSGTAEAGSEVRVAWGNHTESVPADETTGAFGLAVSLDTNEINVLALRAVDPAGNEGEAAEVRITQDSIPPQVSQVAPVDGAVNVPVSSSVAITFSESLDSATVSGALTVNRGGTMQVSGSTVFSAQTGVVTFIPAEDLIEGTYYTVEMTTQVQDQAGNPLPTSFFSAFTTAGTAPSLIPSKPVIDPAPASPTRDLVITVSGSAWPDTEIDVTGGGFFRRNHGGRGRGFQPFRYAASQPA